MMALFHLGIVLVGVPAYRHFGDADFAERAAAGSLVPAAMILGIALVFALFAFYAFAGARVVPRPPFLRTGLVLISSAYGLHGLFLAPELVAHWSHQPSSVPSNMLIDAIFLGMSLPYVIGTARAWPELTQRSRRVA